MILEHQIKNKYLQKLAHQLAHQEKTKRSVSQANADKILCDLLDELGYQEIAIAYKRVKSG